MNKATQETCPSDCVVIKVGGSLLAKPGLPAALQNWLVNDPLVKDKSQRVFLAGGGAGVEALRTIDAANPLTAEVAHWAAIDVMDLNARLLASWMETATLTSSFRQLQKGTPGDWILAPGHFLRQEEPSSPGTPLPLGWEVTSDSIAVRLAVLLRGSLVLLKATPPPAVFLEQDWQKAADCGYVDPFFAQAVQPEMVVNALFLSI